MIEQEVKQENRVRYIVRLNEQAATFLWSSTPYSPLESSVDLKTKVNLRELSWLAENLNCPIKNDEIVLSSLDPYNRLLIYASVRPTVKNVEKIRNLAMLILDLNSWDAFYWASRFRELWWEHKNYRRLLKVARAFKLFFGLG